MNDLVARQRALFHEITKAYSRYQAAVQAANAELKREQAAIEAAAVQDRKEVDQEFERARPVLQAFRRH